MADKKENELTSANNFEWVRALDANGNSIRISKSDLVSVLEGLFPQASLTRNGIMNTNHTKSIGDGFVVNSTSGHKGKYVKLFTINNYNGTISTIEMCSHGDSSSFLLVISLGNGNQSTIAFRNGKLLLGALSGFKFYVVGLSVYMYVPASIKDCYVFISNRQGTVHDGKDILDSIDTSVEISIS